MILRRRQRTAVPSAPALPDVPGDSRGQRLAHPVGRAAQDVAVDRVAAELATAQDGLFERGQILARGVGEHAIDHRVRTGRWIPVFRGVYSVGHAALTDRQRIRAALLAAGPTAVASHRSAAALHGLVPSLPQFVDVTVTGNPRRSRPGLAIHGTVVVPDTVVIAGLPATAPLRTLHDLRTVTTAAELERLCADALVRNLVTEDQLERARLLAPDEAAPTRSALERRFLGVIRQAGLPRPRVNHTVGPYEVDFMWTDARVIVEIDGWSTHGHRLAFERDRARDAELAAAGYVVLRFTWRQLRDKPLLVATRVAQALAYRTATSGGTHEAAGAGRWA